MKSNSFLLIFLFLLIFASSCSHSKQQALLPELEHAEAIMYAYPDSVLKVLEQMRMPETSDRLNHATWALFMTQAKYKNYIKQSDSLANIAFDYFMKQDDPQRKALALYLKGGIYGEMGDEEKAIPFFLEAADEIQKTSDYLLAHLIYIGMSSIYKFHEFPQEYAKEALEKAYNYAKLSGDETYIRSSLIQFARYYLAYEDYDNAIRCYEESLTFAAGMDRGNSGMVNDIANRIKLEMSEIYSRKKEYAKALEYAMPEFKTMTEDNPDYPRACALVGLNYFHLHNQDSAYFYLKKSLETEGVYGKRATCEALVYLSYDKKKYEEMIDYFHQLQIHIVAAQERERTKAILEIQEKYDKEKLLNEKNQLQIEKDRTFRTGLFILIALLCLMVVLIYRYQRRLLQKERTIQKNEEQLRLFKLRIHENEVLISRNNNRINELSMEMEQNQEIQELFEEQKSAVADIQCQNELLRQENETLQKNIRHYSSTLQKKSEELDALNVLSEENLRLQERERFLSYQLFKKTKVLNELKTSPKYLDAVRWEEVKEAIDWLYDDYTKRLTKEFPSLTESDLQICYLMKLHLSISEIATLLGISPTSVSKRKLRLKERMSQESMKRTHDRKGQELWLWEN